MGLGGRLNITTAAAKLAVKSPEHARDAFSGGFEKPTPGSDSRHQRGNGGRRMVATLIAIPIVGIALIVGGMFLLDRAVGEPLDDLIEVTQCDRDLVAIVDEDLASQLPAGERVKMQVSLLDADGQAMGDTIVDVGRTSTSPIEIEVVAVPADVNVATCEVEAIVTP